MHNGEYPYEGAAACSWNFEDGTIIEFEDGRQVVCLDRGLLGNEGWVDIFVVSIRAGKALGYSKYELVRIIRRGYKPVTRGDRPDPLFDGYYLREL